MNILEPIDSTRGKRRGGVVEDPRVNPPPAGERGAHVLPLQSTSRSKQAYFLRFSRFLKAVTSCLNTVQAKHYIAMHYVESLNARTTLRVLDPLPVGCGEKNVIL